MTNSQPSYAFGDFVFRTSDLQLSRHGAPAAFTRQSAEVLCYLIENRDRTVTRAELIDRFWASAPLGADDRLNTCIRRIRNTLDGGDGETSMIETRPRIGYRFLADVDVLSGPRVESNSGGLSFWRLSGQKAAAATISVGVIAAALFISETVSSERPDSVYRAHGYELQKFGDLQSSCDFEEGAETGECSISGDGYVRFVYRGEEVMRTEVPAGAILVSTLKGGRIQFKLSQPAS